MTDLQALSLGELQANRKLLDQVVRSIATSEGLGYVQAYDRFAQGIVDAELGVMAPAAKALEAAGVRVPEVEQHVRLLDQADSQVASVYQEAQPKQLETDGFGRVTLDQDYGSNPSKFLDADGRWMKDPESQRAREDRLRKARKLDAGYVGQSGRAGWEEEDQLHLASGIDLLKTMRRARKAAAAPAQADQLRRELDAQIAADVSHRAALKLLDGDQAGLDARRQKLEQQQPAESALRLLDQPGAPKTDKPRLSASQAMALEKEALPDELSKTARRLQKRVERRMERLGMPRTDYVLALEAEARGDKMPPDPAAPGKVPDAPSNANADLNTAIRQYMLDNNLSDDKYVPIVENYFTTGRIEL